MSKYWPELTAFAFGIALTALALVFAAIASP
jgi:hypothetical protein